MQIKLSFSKICSKKCQISFWTILRRIKRTSWLPRRIKAYLFASTQISVFIIRYIYYSSVFLWKISVFIIRYIQVCFYEKYYFFITTNFHIIFERFSEKLNLKRCNLACFFPFSKIISDEIVYGLASLYLNSIFSVLFTTIAVAFKTIWWKHAFQIDKLLK